MLSLLTKNKKEKEINFQKNGSLLLEELIKTSGGIYNPIRTFSSKQILKATNHFDQNYVISEYRFMWYKGMIENGSVLVKKFEDFSVFEAENFYRDIAVSSLMSSHKNVLKLLGCCLEFPRPVIVYEYPENGALNCIRRGKEDLYSFPWNVRLRIAKEIANSVAYLHTKFRRTIIHRDLKLANIFLDENLSVKLSSFSLSILIPEGELSVYDKVCETSGYIEPGYMNTGESEYNSKGDIDIPVMPVYLGKFLEQGLLSELIDRSFLDSVRSDNDIELAVARMQMEAFIVLAFRCIGYRTEENMLRMIDVAKELEKIENFT